MPKMPWEIEDELAGIAKQHFIDASRYLMKDMFKISPFVTFDLAETEPKAKTEQAIVAPKALKIILNNLQGKA